MKKLVLWINENGFLSCFIFCVLFVSVSWILMTFTKVIGNGLSFGGVIFLILFGLAIFYIMACIFAQIGFFVQKQWRRLVKWAKK